jgi:hypothetical protein
MTPDGGVVTFWHHNGWGYTCGWCGETERGFVMEHHARTLLDGHDLLHTFPDLAGAAVLASQPTNDLTPTTDSETLREAI